MSQATLLLPERSRLVGTLTTRTLSSNVATVLGQAHAQQHTHGRIAQLQRYFQSDTTPWPVAALTRQLDCSDAAQHYWLRVDPAYVVADINGLRLLGHGPTLHIEQSDTQALLPALQSLFSDAGFSLEAPHPARWYIRLPEDIALPIFHDPDDVLGDDVFEFLPEGELGRSWRALLTEAEIILHQQPNAQQRAAVGKSPINSLWFWGAGRLPHINTHYQSIRSHDSLLQALALVAGITSKGEPSVTNSLIDLRHLRSLSALNDDVLIPLLKSLKQGELKQLILDFEDGYQLHLSRKQWWRFWRKPLQQLA